MLFGTFCRCNMWVPTWWEAALGVYKPLDLMIWFDDLTKNEHDLIWQWFDLKKIWPRDLIWDLIWSKFYQGDLIWDLIWQIFWDLDLIWDLIWPFFLNLDLIWDLTWFNVISLDTLLLCTFETLDYPYYLFHQPISILMKRSKRLPGLTPPTGLLVWWISFKS